MRILIVDTVAETSFARPDLRLSAQWNVDRTDSIVHLESALTRPNSAVELVVVYQDRPKQLSQTLILRCLAATPLTRIVQVLGPWCDGDLRTPGRVSGVFTMRFTDANWRLAGMIEQFRLGKGPLVRPLTAPEPIFDAESNAQSSGAARKPLRVGVHLPGRLASGAAASLTALGHSPIVENREIDKSVDVMLVDEDAEVSALTNIPILRLRGFSRDATNPTLAKTNSLAELDAALRSITASAMTRESPTSQSHTNR